MSSPLEQTIVTDNPVEAAYLFAGWLLEPDDPAEIVALLERLPEPESRMLAAVLDWAGQEGLAERVGPPLEVARRRGFCDPDQPDLFARWGSPRRFAPDKVREGVRAIEERRAAVAEKRRKDGAILEKHRHAVEALLGPDRERIRQAALDRVSKWEVRKLCSAWYIEAWRAILDLPASEGDALRAAVLREDDPGWRSGRTRRYGCSCRFGLRLIGEE